MLLQALFAPAMAQDSKLDKKELDQLLAPIALYLDELITNILMASTYPLDVVQAARWVKEPDNAKLRGDALAKAPGKQRMGSQHQSAGSVPDRPPEHER